MLPRQLRVGDLVDDYCPRERRLSNHAIVALVGNDVRQVRCTTCDAEHEYRGGKVPVSRKKAASALPPLAPARAAVTEPAGPEASAAPAIEAPPLPIPLPPPAPVASAPAPAPEAETAEEPSPLAEFSLHRRLIRATLPRVEGDVPPRPIPEFTMHRAAAPGSHRHGKPFRHGQGGGGPHRPGGPSGQGPARQGSQRRGPGEVNGNSFGYRGGQGQQGGHGGVRGGQGPHGMPGGQGQPHGHGPRRGFSGKPPRGPVKH
jgi:hypothetical protein